MRVFFDDTKCRHGLCKRSRAARQLIFVNAWINSPSPCPPYLQVATKSPVPARLNFVQHKKQTAFKLQNQLVGKYQNTLKLEIAGLFSDIFYAGFCAKSRTCVERSQAYMFG